MQRKYTGEIITGPKGGAIVCVSNSERAYEVHPLGDARHREFYCVPAAEDLRRSAEAFINSNDHDALHSSFVRKM